MKLICLNLAIKINNTQEVIDFLLKQNPDIICLQEVGFAHEESVFETFNTRKKIDHTLLEKYPYSYFSPLWLANGFTKVKFGGFLEQGNYILSKFEIKQSSTDFYHKKYERVLDWKTVNFRTEDHARALQTVELICNDKTLRIMNIHGIWTPDKMGDERTITQSKFILEKIAEKDVPIILVGDFNLLPESKSMKIIDKEMRNVIDENDVKSTRPEFDDDLDKGEQVVDYIFVNDKIICKKFEVINTNISDHLPLILEFEI